MDNRRTKIVINKKFQYQYSLLVAAMAVLLVNAFIIFRMLFPGEQPIALTTSMTLSVAAVEFILMAGIWYASLIASHRIAGPVYVFAREISRLGGGDLTAKIRLRDKDMFQLEAAQMNAGITALGDRISTIKKLCEQLQETLTNGGDSVAIAQQLSEQVSTLKTDGE